MMDFTLYENRMLGERYYSARHKSGLPVYVIPKNMSTTYAVLAVRFGSVDNLDEDGGERYPCGVAHFLEHKLFSNEDGSDSFERFCALGADANAYTGHCQTVYLFSCTDRFGECLAELLDFVTHPYFTEESVQKEQGIIAEEIRMCMDDPYDRCYRNMLDALYHNHPVKKDICGSERSVSKITAQTLYDAYFENYTPDNMALIVCGNVTPEEVAAVADAHLSVQHAGKRRKKARASEPASVRAPLVSVSGQVAKPIFAIGIKDVACPADPKEATRRDAAMEILGDMLFSDTGELYERLLDKGLISPELSSGYTLARDFGFFRISGESNEPLRVLEEIKEFVANALKKGLSREDFAHYQRIRFAEYIKGFDSTEEIVENFLAFLFEGADLFSHASVIQGITFEEVERLASSFFDPSRFALSVVYPQNKGG